MKTLTPTKRTMLDMAVKAHILESISDDGYLNTRIDGESDESKLRFLYRTFISEYGWAVSRYGEIGAFKEWAQGLPSSFNIYFTNHDILQFALNTGYYGAKMTERQEEQVLNNWFNLVAVKTFQLFRKYKVI